MAELRNDDQFAAFAARAGDGPVTMLNLLRLVPDGGRAGYERYLRAVAPLLARVGGSLVLLGQGAELLIGDRNDAWDLVVLVTYPRRQALLDMIASDAYRAIAHHRSESVARSVLLALDEVTGTRERGDGVHPG